MSDDFHCQTAKVLSKYRSNVLQTKLDLQFLKTCPLFKHKKQLLPFLKIYFRDSTLFTFLHKDGVWFFPKQNLQCLLLRISLFPLKKLTVEEIFCFYQDPALLVAIFESHVFLADNSSRKFFNEMSKMSFVTTKFSWNQ